MLQRRGSLVQLLLLLQSGFYVSCYPPQEQAAANAKWQLSWRPTACRPCLAKSALFYGITHSVDELLVSQHEPEIDYFQYICLIYMYNTVIILHTVIYNYIICIFVYVFVHMFSKDHC